MMCTCVYALCMHAWLSSSLDVSGYNLCPIGMSGSLGFFQCILMVTGTLLVL